MQLVRLLRTAVRRLLLTLILFYWVTLADTSLVRLFEGGRKAVWSYYAYLACENILEPCELTLRTFLAAQTVYLGLTLLLCFPDGLAWRERKQGGKPNA
jgi:hypothetical protein